MLVPVPSPCLFPCSCLVRACAVLVPVPVAVLVPVPVAVLVPVPVAVRVRVFVPVLVPVPPPLRKPCHRLRDQVN